MICDVQTLASCRLIFRKTAANSVVGDPQLLESGPELASQLWLASFPVCGQFWEGVMELQQTRVCCSRQMCEFPHMWLTRTSNPCKRWANTSCLAAAAVTAGSVSSKNMVQQYLPSSQTGKSDQPALPLKRSDLMVIECRRDYHKHETLGELLKIEGYARGHELLNVRFFLNAAAGVAETLLQL